MVGPAGLLDNLTGLNTQIWLFIILAYYFLATLLPIDKIIGKIYPLFGAAFIFMALGLLSVIFTGSYVVPELSFENMKIDAADFPIIPTLFITIACGAVSGFHATQSPLMARCINNQKECKPVFFGAMIAESLIALIWAAIAMAFFGGVLELNTTLAEQQWNASWVVNLIANTTLGKIGGFLALLGVVVAPITSGDTAFRSARLIVADAFKINQQKIIKRLMITLPLFAIGYSITLINFAVLWRYFAWLNQSLSVATLWAATIYLARLKKKYFITMFPAIFMTFIVSDYLFISNQMFGLSSLLGTISASILTLSLTLYFIFEIKKQANM
jgi:carbon starvation protein CstA